MSDILTLFNDQTETLGKVRAAMERKKWVLLQSATGSGKTAMATKVIMNGVARFTERDIAEHRTIIFTVPREALLLQTSKTFRRYGIKHGLIASGQFYDPFAMVYIGMVDTMARRLDRLPKAKLIIPDETQHGADALTDVIEHYKEQGAYGLGLSATPWKLSGKGLGCYYQEMVEGKSIKWLIENKRLSDYRYFYGRTKLDLSLIAVSAGDYNRGQIASYMEEQRVIIGDCVHDYKERGMGKLWITRCTSIKHSQMQAEAFRDAGIPFVHVDGKTKDKEQIFKAFAKREILGICFADLLNFGFDLSQISGIDDVCIEGASDQKPTKSLTSQMQFWGRSLRYKPYPAIFNDHVNNYIEHGLPCSDRHWTLANRTQSKGKGEKAPPSKQCTDCFFVHPPAPSCPECGTVYEINSREIKEVEGTLVEADKELMRQRVRHEKEAKRIEQGSAKSLEDLIKIGKQRGYKNPVVWATKIYQSKKRIQKRFAETQGT